MENTSLPVIPTVVPMDKDAWRAAKSFPTSGTPEGLPSVTLPLAKLERAPSGGAPVAENFRILLARSGFSAEELSQRCSVHLRTIRKILAGGCNPHPSTLGKLAAGLGVDVEDFFCEAARRRYRRWDRAANREIDDAIRERPELFQGWTEVDFDVIYSRFGTGGPLTREGVEAMAQMQNEARLAYSQLALVLESPDRELALSLLRLLYSRNIVAPDHVPTNSESNRSEKEAKHANEKAKHFGKAPNCPGKMQPAQWPCAISDSLQLNALLPKLKRKAKLAAQSADEPTLAQEAP